MDPQKPDSQIDPYDRLDSRELDAPRIEQDTLTRLTPVHGRSRNKLPAAVSVALAGILVVTGVALGANVVVPLVRGNPALVIAPDETEPPQVGIATPAPSLVASDPVTEPSVGPSVDARPSSESSAEPATDPTVKVTPKPTEKPKVATPRPASGPVNLGNVTVTQTSAGCYRFSWKDFGGRDFDYWKLVHGPWGTQPYYPEFPYWAVLDPSTTVWEGCVDAGDYAVRVQAIYYVDGKATAAAQTSVLHLVVTDTTPPPATVDLGALTVTKDASGCYTFGWKAFGGVDFDYWKLVYGSWGTEPYYPDFPYWAALDPSVTSYKKCGIAAGDYAVRVQAIYYPRGAAYAAAQTAIYHLTVAATPTPTPKPSPVAMSLAQTLNADGVQLSWSKYTGDNFQYYKIVRSETNTNPLFPLNSGTELVCAGSDQSQTSWTDTGVAAGHTYYYRVIAYTFDGDLVLGKSNVVSVAIPAA